MTNHWVDIKNADVILIMGGNAAEAHPCGFKWVTEAKAKRGAKLVVVDPRFTRSAAVADYYAPLRVGTDIAFLGGVMNYLLTNGKYHRDYMLKYTDATFLVNPEYGFKDGYFSGWDAQKKKYDKATWAYQKGADGFVAVDETLKNPNCVFNLMKRHYARYTPEAVSNITGTPKDKFLKVCELIAGTAAPNKTLTILYALGWTQHTVGSQNIRMMAMIQLMLGNVGMAGGGVNALRGHANVQGITDMNLVTDTLPGYMTLPSDKQQTREKYLEARTPKPLRPGQMNFPANFPKWHTSLMKAWYGNAATKENDFRYDWMPKIDKPYDVLHMFERMHLGKMNGFVCQGFNPLAAVPNRRKLSEALSKLKFLVVIDPLDTETASFWQNHGELNDVKTADIQTEVFRLPASCFAEHSGTFTNSGRVIQWHWKAADGPGEAMMDIDIIANIFTRVRELYRKNGGAFPAPVLGLTWAYRQANQPAPEELLMEISGKALGNVYDPKDKAKVLVKAGEQLAGFAQLRDDGSTSCGNWIYSGCWSDKGNLTARRDNADPSGLGQTLNWGFAWPANRRILYNRASADAGGNPWDASRTVIKWDAAAKKWAGNDVPDMRPDAAPAEGVNPFIMNPEGVARLFAVGRMAEGPFPEHYEPFETPIDTNPLHPKVVQNPGARLFKGDAAQLGTSKDFPYAATTYRLTEHMHYWSKNVVLNSIVQPELFVEIGEALAKEKGIANGSRVKVRSKRGEIKAVAVVTKRMPMLAVNGQKVHTVGIPIHWGFIGVAKKGHLANTLTPFVGDANVQTPEFKAFLVNIEKA